MLLALLTFSHLGRNGVPVTCGTALETYTGRFPQSSPAGSQRVCIADYVILQILAAVTNRCWTPFQENRNFA